MALLLHPDGHFEVRTPRRQGWSMSELAEVIGDTVAIVSTVDGRWMAIDDLGKLKNLPLNIEATMIYAFGRSDVIQGPALVIDTFVELQPKETIH